VDKRAIILTVLILAGVVGLAAWSRLRYADREGFDAPQRWKLDSHPAWQRPEDVPRSLDSRRDG
jgi:hypothetical protein